MPQWLRYLPHKNEDLGQTWRTQVKQVHLQSQRPYSERGCGDRRTPNVKRLHLERVEDEG